MAQRGLFFYTKLLRISAFLIMLGAVVVGIAAFWLDPTQAIGMVLPAALLAFAMVMLAGLGENIEREMRSQSERIRAMEASQEKMVSKGA